MILVVFMLIAALIATLGYVKDSSGKFRFNTLCYLFYGSFLMWSVDLFVEIREEGINALEMSAADVSDDLLLTASVTALALAVWGLQHLAAAIGSRRCEAA
jgi:hypothetical protein